MINVLVHVGTLLSDILSCFLPHRREHNIITGKKEEGREERKEKMNV